MDGSLAPDGPGRVVVLNGAPRSGKSSIAGALTERAGGPWVTFGVDASNRALPERLRPGIGLRPGGERPDMEDLVLVLYAALYDSVADHARLGLNVVVDVGHHDGYSQPRHILRDCARRLLGLPVLFVGVRCPLDVIWERRQASWGQARAGADAELVDAVARWQEAVHTVAYDMEVDTSTATPAHCADRILQRLADGPPGSVLGRLAHG